MSHTVSYYYRRPQPGKRNGKTIFFVAWQAREWLRVLRHRGWKDDMMFFERAMTPAEEDVYSKVYRYPGAGYDSLTDLLADMEGLPMHVLVKLEAAARKAMQGRYGVGSPWS